LRLQLDSDPPRAVAAFVLPEDVTDEGHQFAVSLGSHRFGLRQPGVVTSPADFEHGAGGSQRKSLEGELFDQGIRFG
jgi:hypothetical protein